MDWSLEQWRPVVGYEDFYEVSDQGRVRSFDRTTRDGRRIKGRVLKLSRSGIHLTVVLCGSVHRRTRTVHQLVMEAFVGPRPPGLEVAHYDGNGYNNKLSNLRYATAVSNNADKRRHGTYRPPPVLLGKKNWRGKFDADQIREIRSRRAAGEQGRVLAKEYGVNDDCICAIIKRRTYRWVT